MSVSGSSSMSKDPKQKVDNWVLNKTSYLESSASPVVYGLQEIMGSDKFSVSTDTSADSFTIDMENFSHPNDKDVTANSRITMQRTLSRKGTQRLSENKVASTVVPPEKDFAPAGPSPRATLVGSSTPEKPSAVAVRTSDNLGSPPQVHHQITITTGNISTNTDAKCYVRRNSFRRSPPSWSLDPKRVLCFFATVSSMGTMLLIFLTLSLRYNSSDEIGIDWQQQQ